MHTCWCFTMILVEEKKLVIAKINKHYYKQIPHNLCQSLINLLDKLLEINGDLHPWLTLNKLPQFPSVSLITQTLSTFTSSLLKNVINTPSHLNGEWSFMFGFFQCPIPRNRMAKSRKRKGIKRFISKACPQANFFLIQEYRLST
jgi:hypothetical protein